MTAGLARQTLSLLALLGFVLLPAFGARAQGLPAFDELIVGTWQSAATGKPPVETVIQYYPDGTFDGIRTTTKGAIVEVKAIDGEWSSAPADGDAYELTLRETGEDAVTDVLVVLDKDTLRDSGGNLIVRIETRPRSGADVPEA